MVDQQPDHGAAEGRPDPDAAQVLAAIARLTPAQAGEVLRRWAHDPIGVDS